MHCRLVKKIRFQSAHSVPTFPEGHKCRRMHGHSYEADLILEGPIDPALGYVADFAEIKRCAEPLVEQLDHHTLNEIEGLEVPTAEHIAKWIYDRLKPQVPQLVRVCVHENQDNAAEYPV